MPMLHSDHGLLVENGGFSWLAADGTLVSTSGGVVTSPPPRDPAVAYRARLRYARLLRERAESDLRKFTDASEGRTGPAEWTAGHRAVYGVARPADTAEAIEAIRAVAEQARAAHAAIEAENQSRQVPTWAR